MEVIPLNTDNLTKEQVQGALKEIFPRYEGEKHELIPILQDVQEKFRYLPGAAIQEASLGRKMRILPMDADLIKFMEGVGLSRGVIPKGSYKDVVNNDQDIPTIAMANTIVANAKVPNDVVHDFVKVLLGNLDAVRKVHPAFKDFNPKDAVQLANVPLHPGAERAYKEAGLLK